MRGVRAAALAAFVVMAGTLPAFAHAKMVASMPKDGETVAAGLSQIEFTFSKPMRLTLMRVHRGKDSDDVALSNALPGSFTAAAAVAVPPLAAGAYEVSWTAVAEDGHVMQGSFAFTVAEAGGAAPAQ